MANVLVVDDERAVTRSTCILLEDLGHTVVSTERADEVLTLAGRMRFDLILHDLAMPGLDTRAHFERLAADPATQGVPVLIFTASLTARETARQVPHAGMLEKPFTPGELQSEIERLVGTAKVS